MAEQFPVIVRVFLHGHARAIRLAGVGCGIIAVVAGVVYFSMPASAQVQVNRLAVNRPIRVTFSHPVRSSLDYSVSPATRGSWHVTKDMVGGVTGLTFRPAAPLHPRTTYHVSLANVHPLLGVVGGDQQALSLITQALQPVKVVNPLPNTPAPVRSDVVVTMSYVNNGVRRLELMSSDAPLTGPEPATTDGTRFTWHFADTLKQGKTYQLQLKDLNRPAGRQLLQNITFSTVSAPQVTSATTTDHLYPGQPITVVFGQPMAQSDKDFTFRCPGGGKWQDAYTYAYTPATLAPATTCSYTLHKGSSDAAGGVVEADQTYSASSPGAAYVVSLAPSGSSVALSASASVTFDQPVDHTSAQNAFSIDPDVTGTFSWSDNTLTFRPAGGLDYQTTYTVRIGTGVAATYGLPGAKPFSAQFTTVPQTIKLAVPGYKQQYTLSCEESSLRMALAYRGITLNDMDVLQAEGYGPQPRDTTTNTWQDPYETFVGDVNGKEDVTGWGAYGPTIAAASQKLGRSATYAAGITVQQISSAIHNNDPVVLWGVIQNETPRLDSWNTADHGLVTVVANAHVRTVYGVVGSPSAPIGFYLHDPIYGDIYWTTAALQANMTASGRIGSQGVIVN